MMHLSCDLRLGIFCILIYLSAGTGVLGADNAPGGRRERILPERAYIVFTIVGWGWMAGQEIKEDVTNLVANDDGEYARIDEIINPTDAGNKNEIYLYFRAKEINELHGFYILRLGTWRKDKREKGCLQVDYVGLVKDKIGYSFELKVKQGEVPSNGLFYSRQPYLLKTGYRVHPLLGRRTPEEPSHFLVAYGIDEVLGKFERKSIDEEWDRINIPLYRCCNKRLEDLPKDLSFPDSLKDKINYDAGTKVLSFKGAMSEGERDELLKLSTDSGYQEAVCELFRWSYFSLGWLGKARAIDACEELLDALDKAFSISEGFVFLWDKSRITPQSVEDIASPIEKERGVERFSVGMTLYQYQGKSEVKELYRLGGKKSHGFLTQGILQEISIKEADGKLTRGEIWIVASAER